MSATEDQQHRRRHGRHFLIPAGVLIGLGVGIIVGYAGAGVLIGLGLGFLASAFLPPAGEAPEDAPVPCCRHGGRWMSAGIGVVFVIIGAVIIWAPQNFWTYLWPYGVGVFLILIGLSFIAKMLWRSG